MPHGFAADYFSLGVMVYEMATGKYPFAYSNSDTVSDTCSETSSDNDSDSDWATDLGTDSDIDQVLKDSICNDFPSFPEDFNTDLKDLIADKVSKHHL